MNSAPPVRRVLKWIFIVALVVFAATTGMVLAGWWMEWLAAHLPK